MSIHEADGIRTGPGGGGSAGGDAAPARRGDGGRRRELLAIAAGLFSSRGLKATTVRDIADAAGILSGSLYHHFDSKETIVDEILRDFLDDLFAGYHEVIVAGEGPRATIEGLVRVSFAAIDARHDAAAIYQDEVRHLRDSERFAYIRVRNREFRELWRDVLRRGVEIGEFRADLDIDVIYRLLRDSVWVAVRWYRPGGPLAAAQISDTYLAVILDGLATGPAAGTGTE